MKPEQLEILKKALPERTVRTMLIYEALSDQMTKETFSQCDLNPHLQVVHVASKIIEDVRAQGIDCDEREVILHWLTRTIFGPSLTHQMEDF